MLDAIVSWGGGGGGGAPGDPRGVVDGEEARVLELPGGHAQRRERVDGEVVAASEHLALAGEVLKPNQIKSNQIEGVSRFSIGRVRRR